MFYFFSKTITYLLTPAGWLVTILLAAFFVKKPALRRRLIGGALAIFWLFGNPFLTNELARWWEWAPAPVPTDSTLRVAVLLTGGMMNVMKQLPHPPGAPADRFLLDRHADRAGQALYLYKVGAVRHILISGGVGTLPFQPRPVSDEGQMTARFLRLAGVPADAITLEDKSLNTHENAIFSAKMLRRRFGTNRCVLITSAWHMRRAVACFQQVSVVVTPFPANFLSGRRSFAPGEWLLPHEQAFTDSYYLTKELVGYLTYKVVGYI